MIKVYFKEFWCCKSNFCNCEVEDFYIFSHIEGFSDSGQRQIYDHEMCKGDKMIKGTNQRIVKVHFKDDGFWDGVCDCCESIYLDAWNFSHIEGVENPEQYESYDYEMYNGTKASEWDCLVSVFWDLVADKRQYDHFYDMCESFDDVDEESIIEMLSDKGIEVVFISEED